VPGNCVVGPSVSTAARMAARAERSRGAGRDPTRPREPAAAERERGARRELPGAGRGLEVGESGLRGRLDDGVRERCRADGGDDPGAAQAYARRLVAPPPQSYREQEQERPGEVELLLDAQRPVVEHGVLGAPERQVVTDSSANCQFE